MTSLEVCRIGDALGVVLPKEVLSRLNATDGDLLQLAESPDGSLRLTGADPAFDAQMQVAQKGMEQYRNALQELAK